MKMIVEDLYISVPIFEAIQPLLITSRLFGLFPINYKKNGNTYSLQWSNFYGIYSYSLSVGLSFLTVTGMIADIKTDPRHSLRMTDVKTRFVTCGDISIVVVIVVFSTLTLHLKIKMFWKLMNILNQADHIIPFKNPKRIKKASIIFIAAVTFTTGLIYAYDIILKARGKSILAYIKYYFAFYMLYSIVIMIEVFYWHIILLVKVRISLLNQDLAKVRDRTNVSKNVILEDIVGKVYLSKIIVNGEKITNRFNNGRTSSIDPYVKSEESQNIGKWLLSLSIFQDKIFEATSIINNSMELCIHVIMLSCLLHLIVTPYFLLTGLFDGADPFYVILQTVWLLGHIGRVLIIVEPCQICINEHKKTANLICELLTYEAEEEVKKALTILSLQLSYCKLNFSSCGFFKINRSLLTSIAGAVTTYLVILFQFNNTAQ
ncbi:gustatory receptor for sugar taste 43a-like [Diabrotica virgifera virgifera]|uniref:Gustatory receptor n=1 Tax=Diabrotica virgifera virgifera TaxID=50390 RepID=A0A6P7FH11_DIAVI|nr:gustatory receptor for sugar taste 43a-like [Diabrotica virgifera virgifera]